MTWQVEYTNEFEDWWETLTEEEQDDIDITVHLLEDLGPHLPFPHSSGVESSRHKHMRELRIQHAGDPYRILYAFDLRRTAILLIGGNKRGNDRWYQEFVPTADRLYDEHVQALTDEGLLP